MKLHVTLGDVPCGELSVDQQDRFTFQYLPSYVAHAGLALSVSMPLRQEAYPDRVAFPWFENLLPEGLLRHLIADDLGTDVQNIPGLLARLGGDVAGAVSLSAEGRQADAVSPFHDAPLDDRALGRLLEESALHPFLADRAGGPRLSLAGAQQKLPVINDGQAVRLPLSKPSTHLLKPLSPRFIGLPQNEFLCMRAAGLAGLNVAEVALRSYLGYGGEPGVCLQIARYDRRDTGRIHQEDICQALSIVSSRKYEQDGGPGMAQLFDTVRRYSAMPARDIVELLKRVVFNLLIGNEDAHGKNFSLLYSGNKPLLSPAYDLVSTSVYAELSRDFAMRIGEATRFEALDEHSFRLLGEQSGTAPARMRTLLLRFLDQAMRAVEQAGDEAQPWCEGDVAPLPGNLLAQCRARHSVLERLITVLR